MIQHSLASGGKVPGIFPCLILVTAWLLCSSTPSPAQTQASKPLWSVDLADYGYQRIEISRLGANPLDRQTGIFFSDAGQVVAYFITRSSLPKLSARGQTENFNLRGVFLDGQTGAHAVVNDWPSEMTGTYLVPVAGGNLVLLSSRKLQLYSSDFRLLNSFDVPEAEKYEDRYITTSPDGTVLWLIRNRFHSGSSSLVERFDAQSLAPLNSWETEHAGSPSASDRFLARSYPQIKTSVVVSDGAGPWNTILKAKDLNDKNTWCVGDPLFVNDIDLIAPGCGHVVLLSVRGEVLLDDKYEKAWHIERSVSSRNGKAAAVSIMKTKGGQFDTEIRRATTKIIVYDIPHRQRIWDLEISPLPRFVYNFALSPNGSMLAVMLDSVVKIYKIPTLASQELDGKSGN